MPTARQGSLDSKHRHLVKKSQRKTKAKTTKLMIVNTVFSKSGKELNFILKHQTEKPNKNVAKCCTKNPNLFYKQKKFRMRVKTPAKIT